MADYIMREMNDVRSDGETVFYPQIKRFRMFSEDELISKVAMEGSGLSEGLVESVLTGLRKRIIEMIALGYSVKVKGLGVFSASLGIRDEKRQDTADGSETQRNAQSIEARNIRFKADKSLVASANAECHFERKGIKRLTKIDTTVQERLGMAICFLEENAFMKVADYVRLTGLNRSDAAIELKKFSQDPDSGIAVNGRGTHKLYVRGSRDEEYGVRS